MVDRIIFGARTITLSLLILALSCAGTSVSLALENPLPLSPVDVQYYEVTGKKEKIFSWKALHNDDDSVVIIMEDSTVTIENICRDDTGEMKEWRYRDGEQVRLQAKREGNRIIIQGIMDGKPVLRTEEIDDRPWYQALSYSLRNFLYSSEQKITFWTIRANTLDVHAMTAEKVRNETIETVGGPVLASLVDVRVEGVLSVFWHARYWYRQDDGLFLRYQSVHGAVGTETTVVTITSAAANGLDSHHLEEIDPSHKGVPTEKQESRPVP